MVLRKEIVRGKSSSEVQFRQFRLSDLKGVIEIERESFPDPLSPVVLLFLSVSTRFVIAEVGGVVAGYLSLGYESHSVQHIYRTAFSSGSRGKGFGSMILSRFVKKPCTVMTNVKNAGAIRFYEHHGFKKVREIKKKGKTLVYLCYG